MWLDKYDELIVKSVNMKKSNFFKPEQVKHPRYQEAWIQFCQYQFLDKFYTISVSLLTLIPAIDNSLCEAMYVTSESFSLFSTKYITSETPDCKNEEKQSQYNSKPEKNLGEIRSNMSKITSLTPKTNYQINGLGLTS